MKNIFLLFCTLVTAFAAYAQEDWERKTIKVGGYVWPPFVALSGRHYQGLTLDLIDAANATQGDFTFEFVLTTPQKRHQDFNQGKFDVMFFEDIDHGWNAYPIAASVPLAKGTELYVALQKHGRDQRFFQDIPKKSISALKGFHYSFANQNANEAYLREHFKITLDDTPEQVIHDVLNEKSEIGVMNSLYLDHLFAKDPKMKGQLFIGNKYDQDIVLSILVGKKSAMTVEQANLLIERLKNEGVLEKLWKKYQINPKVPITPQSPISPNS